MDDMMNNLFCMVDFLLLQDICLRFLIVEILT